MKATEKKQISDISDDLKLLAASSIVVNDGVIVILDEPNVGS